MIENIEENSILDGFNKLIPYLKYFFELDSNFTVTDTERILNYDQSESMKAKIKPGDPIKTNGMICKVIRTGEVQSGIIPKELNGFAFKAVTIPVKDDDGKVVGTISVGKSLEKQQLMYDLAQNLSTTLQQITTTITNIASIAQNIAQINEKLFIDSKKSIEETKNTNEILEVLKNISKQTNLLGLNAAIEAARAGAAGRGFSIVAQEIRELSNLSSNSIEKTKEILNLIKGLFDSFSVSINESSRMTHDQASSLQEIAAALEEISSTSSILKEIAETL